MGNYSYVTNYNFYCQRALEQPRNDEEIYCPYLADLGCRSTSEDPSWRSSNSEIGLVGSGDTCLSNQAYPKLVGHNRFYSVGKP